MTLDNLRSNKARTASAAVIAVVVGLSVLLFSVFSSSSGTSPTNTTTPMKASPVPAGGSSAPGITPHSVTVGQIDDLTIPIPGLFKGAEDGTEAYFDYVN